MKVFMFECNNKFGGGLAVVAAEDEQQAYDLLIDEYGGRDWLDEYTDLDHCHENKDLVADVTKPQVLESEFYVE